MSALALQCEFCGIVADLVLDEAGDWRCAACLAVIWTGNRLSGDETRSGGQSAPDPQRTVLRPGADSPEESRASGSGPVMPSGGQSAMETAETVPGSLRVAPRSAQPSWAVVGRESRQSETRLEELERRRRLVWATARGLPRLERHRAIVRWLLEYLALPPDVWDQKFAAWRRELETAARATSPRPSQVDFSMTSDSLVGSGGASEKR